MSALHRVVVLDVVALTQDLISKENTPFLHAYTSDEGSVQSIKPAFPALTCSAQSAYTTGRGCEGHGIVGNGFFDREYCEVKNWHQSAKLLQCERIWDKMKKEHPDATAFVNSWWHGMHDHNIDFFLNVRPQYLQDGGKKPDVYTRPAGLREELQGALGTFPLHKFWGPGTGIAASKWIADASIRVDKAHKPTFTAVYLPHLDYTLQKNGPMDQQQLPSDLREIDDVVKDLVTYYEENGVRVVILSEYGISPVDTPVYLNRALRKAGLVSVRTECGGEVLDCGSSEAFALCDHQVAHVYLHNPSEENLSQVAAVLRAQQGVAAVYQGEELNEVYRMEGHNGQGDGVGAHHPHRSGDLVVIADDRSWFAYYYWLQDEDAPDFARCINIHRKPGYDPAEMLLRYAPPWGFLWLLYKLFLVYALRIRSTVDATPLDCSSIKGSHGSITVHPRYFPVLIARGMTAPQSADDGSKLTAEQVYDVLWRHLTLSDADLRQG